MTVTPNDCSILYELTYYWNKFIRMKGVREDEEN